jgi:3-hydroxyisobutyrate dehydrogenase-like beta-hydroxyacid dehydrogenase
MGLNLIPSEENVVKLFSAPIYHTYGSIIADGRVPENGFRMSLALKCIRLTLAAAEAKAVASLVRDHFLEGVVQGEGDNDWSELTQICPRNAGLQTRVGR